MPLGFSRKYYFGVMTCKSHMHGQGNLGGYRPVKRRMLVKSALPQLRKCQLTTDAENVGESVVNSYDGDHCFCLNVVPQNALILNGFSAVY